MAEEQKKDDGGKAQGAGQPETKVTSAVPERTEGQLNPSSPGDTGTTPGTNARVG